MAYVDLNPIRAGIAHDLEHSEFTSIQERLKALVEPPHANRQHNQLAVFQDTEENTVARHRLPFYFNDYLELIDWSGRIVRQDKQGTINIKVPPILDQLGLTTLSWMQQVNAMRQRQLRIRVALDQYCCKFN